LIFNHDWTWHILNLITIHCLVFYHSLWKFFSIIHSGPIVLEAHRLSLNETRSFLFSDLIYVLFKFGINRTGLITRLKCVIAKLFWWTCNCLFFTTYNTFTFLQFMRMNLIRTLHLWWFLKFIVVIFRSFYYVIFVCLLFFVDNIISDHSLIIHARILKAICKRRFLDAFFREFRLRMKIQISLISLISSCIVV